VTQSQVPKNAHLPSRLVEGYGAFLHGRFGQERDRFRHLSESGQKPKIMLIGCCDSRVSPEVIFDADPGEIFVVRNVANLVPPYAPDDDLHGTSAALEFAVMGLRVEHLVVMGHGQCGGVRAFAESEADPYQRPLSPGDFIGKWMTLIVPAAQRVGKPDVSVADYTELLALESIKQSLINLRSFPCVRILEERGRLSLHGAYFSIASGQLQALDESSGAFVQVADDQYVQAFSEPRF
jgi:carbonic anhydrase